MDKNRDISASGLLSGLWATVISFTLASRRVTSQICRHQFSAADSIDYQHPGRGNTVLILVTPGHYQHLHELDGISGQRRPNISIHLSTAATEGISTSTINICNIVYGSVNYSTHSLILSHAKKTISLSS